ncbi:MAG TPA: hypothetical protein VEI97_14305, partial [bacterium]|nr:hypothetical protein [bacterium]
MDKQTPTVAVVIAGSLDEWLHTARERRMFDSSCPQITYAFTEAPAPPLGQARTPAERTALLDRLTAVEWNEAYESLCGRPGNGTTSPRLGQDLCLEPADIDPFEVLFTEGGCQQHRFRVQAPGRPATSLIGEFGVIPMPDGRSAAGIWLTLFPHTEQACG